MTYSWEEVKQAVERVEDVRLERELAIAEADGGHAPRKPFLLQRMRPYLEVLGAMLVGVYVAISCMIFNFLVFVWLFHVNFNA